MKSITFGLVLALAWGCGRAEERDAAAASAWSNLVACDGGTFTIDSNGNGNGDFQIVLRDRDDVFAKLRREGALLDNHFNPSRPGEVLIGDVKRSGRSLSTYFGFLRKDEGYLVFNTQVADLSHAVNVIVAWVSAADYGRIRQGDDGIAYGARGFSGWRFENCRFE